MVSLVCSEGPSGTPGPWGGSVNAVAVDDIGIYLINFNNHHLHPVLFIKMHGSKAVYQ